MGGCWDKPNLDSEPGKARWLVKRDREGMLYIRGSNHQEGHRTPSLSPPCKSVHIPFSLLSLFPSLCGNSFLQSQGLVTGHWSSWQDAGLSLPRPDFSLWLETEILFQAASARGHPRSRLPGGRPKIWTDLCQSFHALASFSQTLTIE